MAMKIEPERQRLMEQVLEYWYTAGFMNQGSLQTEQTRRDKENYAFAMNHPKQFGSLYRHEFLLEGESSFVERYAVIPPHVCILPPVLF